MADKRTADKRTRISDGLYKCQDDVKKLLHLATDKRFSQKEFKSLLRLEQNIEDVWVEYTDNEDIQK